MQKIEVNSGGTYDDILSDTPDINTGEETISIEIEISIKYICDSIKAYELGIPPSSAHTAVNR